MKYRVPFLSILLLLSVTACGVIGGRDHNGFIQTMPMLLRGLPQGDDAFSMGFRDGCYHLIGQMGYGFNRFHDRPVRPQYITNAQYRSGYEHGDRHCGVFVNRSTVL